MCLAVKINRYDIVDHLLVHGKPVVDLVDTKNGMSPLLYAIKNKNLEIVQMLLSRGASVKLCDFKCMTALMAACAGGDSNMPIISILVEQYNADVDVQDENGWTALHYAVYANAPEIISFLLNTWGANRNIRDYKRTKPIQLALIKKYGQCVACLEDLKSKMAMVTGEMDVDD